MNEPRICPDKDLLISVLYGEATADEQRQFDAHAAGCPSCAAELEGLRGVRASLAGWQAPDEALGFRLIRQPAVVPLRRRWTAVVPRWAGQAAAAVLLLAGGAAIANLDVRYGGDGLVVRTGWQKPAGPVAVPPAVQAKTPVDQAPWRPELSALERQLRQEMATTVAAGQSAETATASRDDAQVIRRVERLIAASEERQRREWASGLLRISHDVERQRQVDLSTIRRTFGQFENRTGMEVLQNREKLDYLLRVSQMK